MDTTNSSENPQRRVEDRKPAEVIDWAAPGAPAVPLSPAATSGDAPADLQQLKALALAATPGPWSATHWSGHAPTTVMRTGETMVIAETTGFGRLSSECAPDAAYIAAANPAVVLDLIARIERLTTIQEHAPSTEQEWAKVDPAVAFHLIERHAEDWADAGRMMEAWRDATANIERAASPATASGDELPRPDCTYADHSYPAYSANLVRKIRDEARAAVSAATKPTADAESAWKQYIAQRTQLMDTSGNRAVFAAGYSAAATKPTADLSKLVRYDSFYDAGRGVMRANMERGEFVSLADVQSLLATKPAGVAPELVREALDIAHDLAVAEADRVHETCKGYKQHKHEAADRDVETIKRAIDAINPTAAPADHADKRAEILIEVEEAIDVVIRDLEFDVAERSGAISCRTAIRALKSAAPEGAEGAAS